MICFFVQKLSFESRVRWVNSGKNFRTAPYINIIYDSLSLKKTVMTDEYAYLWGRFAQKMYLWQQTLKVCKNLVFSHSTCYVLWNYMDRNLERCHLCIIWKNNHLFSFQKIIWNLTLCVKRVLHVIQKVSERVTVFSKTIGAGGGAQKSSRPWSHRFLKPHTFCQKITYGHWTLFKYVLKWSTNRSL